MHHAVHGAGREAVGAAQVGQGVVGAVQVAGAVDEQQGVCRSCVPFCVDSAGAVGAGPPPSRRIPLGADATRSEQAGRSVHRAVEWPACHHAPCCWGSQPLRWAPQPQVRHRAVAERRRRPDAASQAHRDRRRPGAHRGVARARPGAAHHGVAQGVGRAAVPDRAARGGRDMSQQSKGSSWPAAVAVVLASEPGPDSHMAVFTELASHEVEAFVARLQAGELIELHAHRRRHREHQLLRHHRARPLCAHRVRAAEPRAAAVLPAPDAAPGASAACRCPSRSPTPAASWCTACTASRPRWCTRLPGHTSIAPDAGALRAVGAMLARMHLAAADFPAAAAQPARARLVEGHRAAGAAVPRRPSTRSCSTTRWPSSSRSPRRRRTPACRAAPCMPTCSATT